MDLPRRSIRPTRHLLDVAPWILVAILLHAVVFLAAYVWAPMASLEPPAVIPVSLYDGPNPFATTDQAILPTPAEPEPQIPDPPPDEANAPPTEQPQQADASPQTQADATDVDRSADSDGDLITDSLSTAGNDAAGPLGNRQPSSRGGALGRYGGTAETESAVTVGLAWLAAHQHTNGSWDRQNFNRNCPPEDICGGVAVRWLNMDARPGLTGLATLAFLAAGHTHHQGAYQPVVDAALTFLLAQQEPNGSFAPPQRLEMYNHAIATLALAESYTLTRDDALAQPLRRAVDHLIRSQQSGGGWDYRSDLTTGRNDTSITGWVVMALKAASTAGLNIPDATVLGVLSHFGRATEPSGRVWYADTGTGTKNAGGGRLVQRYGPAMTAVGMLSRQLLGWRADAHQIVDQARLLLTDPPDAGLLKGGDPTGLHSYYYWYHGTLAMFLRGGDDWIDWNVALKRHLLAMQDQTVTGGGRRRHVYGSWPGLGPGWGKWGRTGGRVYTTALAVLTLETYYRYVPQYALAHPLIRPRTLRVGLAQLQGTDRHRLASVATQLPVEVGEPMLVDALAYPDARLRLVAAIGLAAMGNPLGQAVLERQLTDAVGQERTSIEAALHRLDGMTWGPTYGAVTRADLQHGLIVFETAGESVYIGQAVELHRKDQVVGVAEVVRRHQDQSLAVARVESGSSAALGDLVSSSAQPR